jgi:CheY-like chemotaxis protein
MKDRAPAGYKLSRGSETILVGVDDETLRVRVQIALETCGYDVLAAHSGAQAWRLAARQGVSVSLLVCQLATPEMDGKELARRLTSLAAARHGQPRDRRRLGILLLADDCAAAPAGELVACLETPVRPSTLVARVRQLLDARSGAGGDRLWESQAPPADGNCLDL